MDHLFRGPKPLIGKNIWLPWHYFGKGLLYFSCVHFNAYHLIKMSCVKDDSFQSDGWNSRCEEIPIFGWLYFYENLDCTSVKSFTVKGVEWLTENVFLQPPRPYLQPTQRVIVIQLVMDSKFTGFSYIYHSISFSLVSAHVLMFNATSIHWTVLLQLFP